MEQLYSSFGTHLLWLLGLVTLLMIPSAACIVMIGLERDITGHFTAGLTFLAVILPLVAGGYHGEQVARCFKLLLLEYRRERERRGVQ